MPKNAVVSIGNKLILLFYRGRDSSAEGQTRIQRGRLFYGGETRLRRGRLIYGGGDSSTKGEARLGTILDATGNFQNGSNTECSEYMYMNIIMYI
jgi:hypothetical protein